MNTQFTVDYFLDKFEKIPEDKWAIGALENEKGQKCALGHCLNKVVFDGLNQSAEVDALVWVLDNPVQINNGYDKSYPQPTPKQRILAALRDIKKMTNEQNPEPSVATVDAQRTERWPNKTSSFTNIIEVVEETSDLILNETI